jgi:Tfp pilus assembly protein PilF/peroxiredoxin
MRFFSRERGLVFLLMALAGVFILPTAGATLQGLQVGVEAPDFQLRSPSGGKHDFAELHGEKLTIVLFWATWSRKSEAALSRMEELYSKYRDQGLGVIAINADGQVISSATEAAIRDTAQRLKLDYPLLVDNRLQTFHDYGIIALPTLVLLDSDRIIRYEMSGFPLIGVEEMVDFVVASIEGRSESVQVAQKSGYQPDSKALHFFNMGRKTLKSKRMSKTAEMWFKKAIAADGSFLQPHLSLGRFYMAHQNVVKAAEQYAQVLEKAPDNVVALCESGMLLARDGKDQEAEELLSRSMQKDEFYTPCYYYLGYLKGRKGELGEVMSYFDQALEINRTSPDIYIYMGRMFEERQEPEQAANSYRKALESMLGSI